MKIQADQLIKLRELIARQLATFVCQNWNVIDQKTKDIHMTHAAGILATVERVVK